MAAISHITGSVYDGFDAPLVGVHVNVYDKDLRSEQLLGETLTDAKGSYSVEYDIEKYNKAEVKSADIFLRVFNDSGAILGESAINFSVPTDFHLDFKIDKQPYKGLAEFDLLVSTIAPLLEGQDVAIGELQENEEIKDISFLAGETGEDADKISHLKKAYVLTGETKVAPDIFYSLFRLGFPTELNTLLQIKAESIRTALKQAIEDHIISSRWLQELDRIIKILDGLASNQLQEGIQEGAEAFKKVMGPVLSVDLQKTFLDTYFTYEAEPDKFLENLKLQPGFEDGLAIEKSSTVLRLNLITDGQPELVNQLYKAQENDEDLKDIRGFAKYNKKDWKTQIETAGVVNFPEWVGGKTPEEKAESYADALEGLHKQMHPTTFFAARLKEDGQSAFLLKDKLQLFFGQNPDFDLNTKNIGKQLDAANFGGIQDREAVKKELKTINRLYKLTDEYTTINALYGKQVFSATDIVTNFGKEQFTSQFATELGSVGHAVQIYKKAVSVNNKATALITAYKMRHDVKLFAIDGQNAAPEGYRDMFGDGELCECEHCQSVYSPSAYFVDMLAFIKSENKEAFDELLRRRPDLDDILLTCKNINTPLPYIDLVNELLEKEVVRLSGITDTEGITAETHSYQTEGLAAGLMATPEHGSVNANEQLKIVADDVVFSPFLPLDLPLEEVRAYSGKLGGNRFKLLEAFRGKKEMDIPNDAALAAELFGFSDADLKIINGTSSFSVSLPNNLKGILEITKLSYIELLQLLETYFLNPKSGEARTIKITQEGEDTEPTPLLTCNLDKLRLTGANDAWFNKMARFVRLWKKLDWDIFELDRILTVLDIEDFPETSAFNEEMLFPLAEIEKAKRNLSIPMGQLVELFGNMDKASYLDHTKEDQPPIVSLYDELFGKAATIDVSTVSAAMGISSSEYSLLQTSEDFSLEGISKMYRFVVLAKTLRISLADFMEVTKFTGNKAAAEVWVPEKLYNFLEQWKVFKAIGINVMDFKGFFAAASDAEYTIPVDYLLLKSVTDCIDELREINRNGSLTEGERQVQSLAKLKAFLQKLSNNTELATALSASLSNPEDVSLKTVVENHLGDDNQAKLESLPPHEMIANLEALQQSLHDYINVVLKKAPKILTRLKFDPIEILWLKENKEALGIALVWNETIDFEDEDFFKEVSQLYYLSELAQVKTSSKSSWIDLLQCAIQNADDAKENFIDAFAEYFSVRLTSLDYLCGSKMDVNDKGHLKFSFPEDDVFAENLLALLNCCAIIENLGGSVIQFKALLNPTVQEEDVREVQNLLKSKYGNNEWLDVLKPISDKLRTKRRNALQAWLLANANGAGWHSSNAIYDWLLIDTEMEACMVTSRIKQAIGSIQLYIDRCLMHLEKLDGNTIVLGEAFAKQWHSWRKQYRVWEADRKIFLYPENWIEPDLRDGKSSFFQELESQLNQNEITEDTAKEALLTYLGKLDNVANLEMVGLFNDEETKILHVFGRTQNIPHQYFYRKQENKVWTAWEKVDVDIEGDHIVPVVWNGRLLLFWGQFTEKQEESNGDTSISGNIGDMTMSSPPPPTYLEMKLAWSEYKKGKWGPKKISKESNSFHAASPLILRQEHISLSPIIDEGKLYIRSICPPRTDIDVNFLFSGSFPIFVFDGCNSAPKLTEADFNVNGLRSRIINKLPGIIRNKMMIAEKANVDSFGLYNTGTYKSYPIVGNLNINTIFQNTPGMFQLLPDAYEIEKDRKEIFFYQNDHNNFYAYSRETQRPIFGDLSVENLGVLTARRIISPVRTWTSVSPSTNGVMLHSSLPFVRDTINPDLFNGVFEVVQPFKILMGKRYLFQTFYHPYVCSYIQRVNTKGIDDLYSEEVQSIGVNPIFSASRYNPTQYVLTPYPVEELDFSYGGSYSLYNWELFFHIPLMIAARLSQNQKFEEARKWFHYIFDPTKSSNGNSGAERFWITKPFKNEVLDGAKTLEDLLNDQANAEDLELQLSNWENNPFNPHAVARLRISAYMRNTVLRYIDNLVQWGDQLFRRDTIESINEATLLYILASNLLGKKPEIVPARANPKEKTFSDIGDTLDRFSNAKSEIESFISPSSGDDTVLMPYFCLPKNDYILNYWDTVADRLFKIRHCMNIEGVVRQLPLFEPPIDPSLLVRATAAGLDLNSILNDMDVPLPHYRFQVMLQQANELCNDVKGLGNMLLSALEKKDGEEMALLRSAHELRMLEMIKDIKEKQRDEAKENLNSLSSSKTITNERYNYYINKSYTNTAEQNYFSKTKTASRIQEGLAVENILSSILFAVPNIKIGSGFTIGATYGGENLGKASGAAINSAQSVISFLRTEAEMSNIKGSFDQRMDEWKFQTKSAELELKQMDKQIIAAEIRLAIAEKELENHNLQMEQSQELDEYMRSKFTNVELYDWMVGQLSTMYFQSYQLAYTTAKKAEKCMQYELGLESGSYVQFGYWDSLKKGLLSGEKLQYDLRRLENAYLEENEREYEIVKHVSLAMLDPLALIILREAGTCHFSIPEVLYDMDHPGHYLRRLKSVSVSMPCIAGSYTSVSAKLSLGASRYRKSTAILVDYIEIEGSDERFVYPTGSVNSIATSNAQNDSGVFELNFRDDRYLPFEGCGAIGSWELELPSALKQFDYNTIFDVVIHIKYTAREGGASFKEVVNTTLNDRLDEISQQLEETGLHTALNMKHDLSNEWHQLKSSGQGSVIIDKSRLPYIAQALNAGIESVMFIAKVKANPANFTLQINDLDLNLSRIDGLGMNIGSNADIELGTSFRLGLDDGDLPKLEELVLVVKYSF